ncbi:MAG: zinc ABC transporter substrate-binding protein [Chloroflexi bacterium]|nr:zinc ABC transporter substrate-binding protein [Chloroflexota bacterium]
MKKNAILLIFLFLVFPILFSCSRNEGSTVSQCSSSCCGRHRQPCTGSGDRKPCYNEGSGRIGVITTLVPLEEFAEKVGGDKVSVTSMVPPGANPHTFEPRPGQLKNIGNAKIYIKAGSCVEFELAWLSKLLALNKNIMVIDASRGIRLIGRDPHIWLSPKNAEIIVKNIYEGLAAADPKNKDYYKKNMENYIKELEALDSSIAESLKKTGTKEILVYHPAWAYFAARYGLEEIPIEEDGKEPSPRRIGDVVKKARKKNIVIIIASPEFNTRNAEIIANEINGKVVLISDLEKDYIKNLSKVVLALEKK